MKLIEKALSNDMPVLGVCLGAQLLAKTLGARVYRNRVKEIGWYDVSPTKSAATDPLLRQFGGMEKIFQWHGDTFDIPKTAVHLAASPLCANQAFRYGSEVYGFQFHLEVDAPMIERWLNVPENVKEISRLNGDIDPEVIRRETPLHVHRLRRLSSKTFGEFINLFGVEKKRRLLPSR